MRVLSRTFAIGSFCWLAALFICGCQSDQINPMQPEETYVLPDSALLRPLSVIHVPVNISVADVERQINNEVKGLLYEDSSLTNNGNDNFLVKVWKRENVTIEAVNNLFNITVPLKIWAKGGITFNQYGIKLSEFRETEFALNARFVTRITANSQWQVRTQTSSNGFDWVTKPKLQLGPVEISLDSFLGDIIDRQQDRIAKELDEQVQGKLDVKKYVQQAWRTVQQPILLSEAYNTWLRLSPTEVLMTPLSGNGKQIKAQIGIKGYTETIVGNKPDVTINNTLPPLQMVSNVPDSVTIGLSSAISHEYATKIASDQFLNKTFTFNDGKYQVTVKSIDLYGSGGNLVIQAGLTGSINGTVYLKGKPAYNPATQSLELQNLDYDLDTKNKLIKTANWLAKGKLLRSMQDAFKIPIGKQLTQARQLIGQNITNKSLAKGITLNGTLSDLAPADVYITPTSIVAVVLATGSVDVKVEGL